MTAPRSFRIEEAVCRAQLEEVCAMFNESAATFDLDPTFVGGLRRVSDLPGQYAAPKGVILLAIDDDGTALACGAMRPLPGPGDCDMSVLFVRPEARGRSVGIGLAQTLTARARAAGHRRAYALVVDGTPAAALLQRLGFVASPHYFPNPAPGTAQMVCELLPIDAD